jgi:glycosyltransferase involved in cell wall biosynthesis
MRPLRVITVIDSLAAGGAERSLADMLPGLSERGITPLIVCFYHRTPGFEDEVRERFDVRYVDAAGVFARARALRTIARAERADLIHTTLFESDLAGRLAHAGTTIPVLSSLVNTPYADARLRDPRIRRSRLRAARTIDGWTARHLTTHFHAITRAAAEHGVTKLRIPPERITVIERGRDGSRFPPITIDERRASRLALGIEPEAEVVLTLGRQEEQKGQRHLLDAMATLSKRRPRLVLIVAGRTGEVTGQLEAQRASLGLEDAVRFLGFRDDVGRLLAAADLFVFPSLWEGLGGSLIEAMARGLPIVASDIDAVREVVEHGHNAVLVPPASSEPLAAAIEKLLDDEMTLRAFAARSRTIFEERFTLEGINDRMADLYRRLAAGTAGMTVDAVEPRAEPSFPDGRRT